LKVIENQLRLEYYRCLLGRQLRVLVETRLPENTSRAVGTACRYAPVEITDCDVQVGKFANIRADRVQDERIIGSIAGNDSV